MSELNLNACMPQFWDEHKLSLSNILKKHLINIECPKILEIGSWVGNSTSIFCEFLKKKNNGEIHCVDTFKGSPQTPLIDFATKEDNGNVRSIFENNMNILGYMDLITIYQFSSFEAHNFFPNDYFDLIFIDADHLYTAIKQDIENYSPKCKKNGIMCGHDMEGFEYDSNALGSQWTNGRHDGVIKAVLEYYGKRNIEILSNIWCVVNK